MRKQRTEWTPVKEAGAQRMDVGCRWLVRWTSGQLAALALLLVAVGCTPDSRISMQRLEELTDVPAEAPTEVTRGQLALTDVRPYKIVPGDVLQITMLGLREDRYEPVTVEARVHDDGNIVFPVIGEVAVADKTFGAAEQAIVAAHEEVVRDLAVHVQLGGAENTTVLVQGAVAQPGLVRLPGNQCNIVYALSEAGGFQDAGSGRVHLHPIRADREPLVFDLKDINDVRRALVGPRLESGDVLVVESAPQDVVFVTGLVNAPGPVPVPRDGEVSLVRVIAASGGLRDFLDPPEATLWRRLPDGEQVRVKVELAEIMSGEATDVALAAGDVLDVPHTPETRLREWVANNIRIGPFGVTAVYDPVADYRARILQNDQDDLNSGLFRRTLLQTLGSGVSNIVLPPVDAPPLP